MSLPLIGLQAGHQNIQQNPDPTLASETGAPGEEQFNVAIRDALSVILQKYGFPVQLDDANANNDPNTTGKDFGFYLALHAEGSPPGGNVVAPDPTIDESNAESIRIVQNIVDHYFSDTGIECNGIVTANETEYYMWSALTGPTPCGIIECGDLADPHDSVILADHQRVALGIAHGITAAFNLPWNGTNGIQTENTPIESTNQSSSINQTPSSASSDVTASENQSQTASVQVPVEYQGFWEALINFYHSFWQKKNE